ncbi:MAG: CoA-binding protein [Gammaproteobacteria bacterium]|nr:CoA-binding protein [Gammaproteobacteria bacterium]
MSVFVKIDKGHYIDSLETLFASSVLIKQEGVSNGLVGVGNDPFKKTVKESGLDSEKLNEAASTDLVIIAECDTEEHFDKAVLEVFKSFASENDKKVEEVFTSVETAYKEHPEANMVSVAVPGEYALSEVKKALNLGLHCVVFSNNVPLEEEREMKELAREKGLLCMGPDCGVANINGAALVLSSINNRGPFGICGATGTGIQHVAAIMHEAGSGVSQTIGTGGNDLKDKVGGIMMLMGIDALEADPETQYIVLISRKPGETVFPKILERVSKCKKPVVALFMGADKEVVEKTGAIYASDLDDCALKALKLIGINYHLATEDELKELAKEEVKKLSKEQKYVRGLFSGGTYMDEATHAMLDRVGPIYSNCPLRPEWKLEDSYVSKENSIVDYGEEEFTLGHPHPAIDPSVRKPAILKEAADPEVAVIMLDFILTPPGHPDPTGYVLDDIRMAQQMAEMEGRHIIFIASVLGTTADLQDINVQKKQLEDNGVIVCQTNYRASILAGEIIRLKKEMD